MTFDEWADQYDLDLDSRATCLCAWGEATIEAREACAKVCDEVGPRFSGDLCAARIRALSNTVVTGRTCGARGLLYGGLAVCRHHEGGGSNQCHYNYGCEHQVTGE